MMLLVILFFNSPLWHTLRGIDPPAKRAQKEMEKEAVQKQQMEKEAVQDRQSLNNKQGPITAEEQDDAEATPEIGSSQTDSSAGDSTELSYDTIWIETEKLICGISELGGRIISVRTKEYTYDPTDKQSTDYIEIIPPNAGGAANLTINDKGYDSVFFDAGTADSLITVEGEQTKQLRFVHTGIDGKVITKKYAFSAQEYVVDLSVRGQSILGASVGMGWKCGIKESEKIDPKSRGNYDQKKVHIYNGKNVSHISEKKAAKNIESGYYEWIGLTSKYFLAAILGNGLEDSEIAIEAFEVGETQKKNKDIDYSIEMKRFSEKSSMSYQFYVGPSKLNSLKRYNKKLKGVLFGGWKFFFRADLWFPVVCEFVLMLLIVLQKAVKDYGIVIIMLTAISKVVTYPLTQSSMKSMSRMKDMAPKIDAIKKKYKGNPAKMNQEVMAFYKSEGVNPLNPGCLPMFLQMPIFLSLFVVLRKAIELRGASTWIIPWVNDLSQPEALPIVSDILKSIAPNGLPMYGDQVGLLPIIMAVLTFFQNKMTIKDPNQKAMIYIMPIFLLVLFNNFPAGLVLYWTVSSALGIVQQYLVNKKPAGTGAVIKSTKQSSKR
ncbi:MAG: membrane protein insertase YidC [Chitinivibrionales bacterium]|nr:membrane protein insertase YidC [Chitinivibrionales bacterium]